jgi:2-iminobutanoate/2-iminopropanoate deaminase
MNSIRWAVLILAGSLLGGCNVSVSNEKAAMPRPVEYYPTTMKADPPLPFSEAVRVGDTLYLAGQLGVAPGATSVVPGGIGPEARQVMDNISAVLARHGSSLDHVVKCSVFLADIKEWPAFNEVYRQYFKKDFPARSAFATTGLAWGARVEVECIAYIPSVTP